MVGVGKLCYIVIIDEEEAEGNGVELASCSLKKSSSFLYTRPVLQSMLQLVGCKVNHSFKIARRVFDILESENLQPAAKFGERGRSYSNTNALSNSNTSDKNFKDIKMTTMLLFENLGKDLLMNNKEKLFDLYKKETAIIVKRERFLDVICHSLAEYHYVGLSQRADIALACRVHERKDSVTILLCGTSGCGKSTLSSLLASRLGITTVVSTDSIRHMMRGFVDEKDNPLLWASTYHAGEFLDPISIAKAKAKKKAMKVCTSPSNEQFVYEESATIPGSTGVKFCHKNETVADDPVEIVGSKVLAIAGYKAQSEMVIDSLDRLITIWEDRKESVVVEGVHLSLNFVMGLMKKHPSIMPFLIYIANEEKHLERFAVRAKYMTLDPQKNKYVKYIRNIRTIQDYLCKRADKHLVPQVNNTNIDRSVASIHSTIFSCLRKRQMGELLYDIATNTVKVINEEYSKQCSANSISSKGMFRVFQRQGSSGRYMAIINSDGSIAKAWPFSYLNDIEELRSSNGGKSSVGSPIYGPLRIGKTEPVNIQFGNFGISSWPNDLEGTSYTSSMNTSRVDGDEDTACYSSCSSSALHSEGHEKELIEDEAVPESDEELPDEEVGSSDSAEELEEDELGGSVVESSTRSDEEYETDQLNERSSADLIGHFTYLYDDCSVKCKPSKSCSRTLSMRPNRKPIRERRLYSRCRSLPIEEHQANTQIDANTPKSSSDVYMDGSNRCG